MEELLTILEREGHILEAVHLKNRPNIYDEEWDNVLSKLAQVRLQLLKEDEEWVKTLALKY